MSGVKDCGVTDALGRQLCRHGRPLGVPVEGLLKPDNSCD